MAEPAPKLATEGGKHVDETQEKSKKKGGGPRPPFFSAEAATFYVPAEGPKSAMMPLQLRIKDNRLSNRARDKVGGTETRVLIVTVDKDGNEHRTLQPLAEIVYPVNFERPGTYTVLGLIVGDESSAFAKAWLLKRDPETGEYMVDLIDHSGKQPEFRHVENEYGSLRWASRIKPETVTLDESYFLEHGTSPLHSWLDVWSLWTPLTRFGLWLHYATAPFRLLAALIFQVVTGMLLTVSGLFYSVVMASRGFDWGAIKSLDVERKRRASQACEFFSRTRFDEDGNSEMQGDHLTILSAPIWWVPGATVGLLIGLWSDSVVAGVLVAVGAVLLHAFSLLRIANNDGEVMAYWQYCLRSLSAFIRDLPVSRILAFLVFWKREKDVDAETIEILSQKDEKSVQSMFGLGTKLKLRCIDWFRWVFQPVHHVRTTKEADG